MTERLNWHKSSYSGGNAGACVEVAEWHKSSYSGASGGDCVEVADARRQVHVRDSKHPHQGHLTFPAASWHAFVSFLKVGDLAE